jgi:hypothetical protein
VDDTYREKDENERTEEIDPNMDIRIWDRLSNRPENLLTLAIPRPGGMYV